MRILVAVLAASLELGLMPGAGAVESGTPSSSRETAPDAVAPSREKQLDALFETLKTANDDSSRAAENGILRLWLESGSDTVDLMMTWALAAMESKDYPLALDFLDRITALKPDYVEGWNKRATVHFLADDYGKSISDIERVLVLEPRHFGALAGLGSIFRELGDDKRALAAYKQALAIDPLLENVKKAIDDLESKGKDI